MFFDGRISIDIPYTATLPYVIAGTPGIAGATIQFAVGSMLDPYPWADEPFPPPAPTPHVETEPGLKRILPRLRLIRPADRTQGRAVPRSGPYIWPVTVDCGGGSF
jgi:hypothetical protein